MASTFVQDLDPSRQSGAHGTPPLATRNKRAGRGAPGTLDALVPDCLEAAFCAAKSSTKSP